VTAVLLGIFAALCWSIHDLVARRYAPSIGAFQMALWVMLLGAALLLGPVFYRNVIMDGDLRSWMFAIALGVAYAMAVGGLFKAFSLAPVSIVSPFTAWYPALVVLWGLAQGLHPTSLEWFAIFIILAGAVIVARFGHEDGGLNAIEKGKLGVVVLACGLAVTGYAASIVLGQIASEKLGEFETTLVSRFPAAALLLPLALKDRQTSVPLTGTIVFWLGVMALLDVLAVSGINYSGQFENKEYAGMGISAYGAITVLLATIVLKERVSIGQWLGILMIASGVGILAWK
jgi:drug/metabolite transporter (DMT)-like permease